MLPAPRVVDRVSLQNRHEYFTYSVFSFCLSSWSQIVFFPSQCFSLDFLPGFLICPLFPLSSLGYFPRNSSATFLFSLCLSLCLSLSLPVMSRPPLLLLLHTWRTLCGLLSQTHAENCSFNRRQKRKVKAAITGRLPVIAALTFLQCNQQRRD